MNEEPRRLGIADLTSRLGRSGLNVIEQSQPWPQLRATYFEIGKGNRATNITLSDELLRDLPATREYQTAVDLYAEAVAGRIRCGSPNLFYCFCNRAISTSIRWPIQAAAFEGNLNAWLLVDVTDEQNQSLAKCCLNVDRQFSYSGRTTFDDVRNAVTRIRRAIDGNSIQFYEPDSHPDRYQPVEDGGGKSNAARQQSEIEKFVAGKTYTLGFQLPDTPGEVYATDPWDAEYLGISKKDLSQSAYVLRARGLIDLDPSLLFAKPSDKLVTTGWPTVANDDAAATAPQAFELSALPKKEQLKEDLVLLLNQAATTALLFLDLDKFKEVNDTKGHAEGDMCLARVVTAIGSALGRKGKLYRWGGDEFAITLPDFSTEEARVTAERIRRSIEDAKAGGETPVTASIGVCATDVLVSATAGELLEAADRTMYDSKRNGKNRVTAWPVPAKTEGLRDAPTS